ncbi:MAG: YciI family protein, partial [Acidobacteriia bacterium]|nr:YciI family protein [Terriglobia bacterium]
EKDWAEKSKEEQDRIYADYWNYTIELKKSGKMLSCEPLDPTSSATTIRVRDGKTIPTDGPFADTKEQLGGIYVIDVKDLNEAMAWASKIPDARTGSIEIRPLMNVPEM